MQMNAATARNHAQRILNFTMNFATLSLDELLAVKAAVPNMNFTVLNKHAIIGRIENQVFRLEIREIGAMTGATERRVLQLQGAVGEIENYLENQPLPRYIVIIRRILFLLVFCSGILGGVALVFQDTGYLIASAVLAIASVFSAIGIEYINTLGRNFRRYVLPQADPPG